MFHQLHPIIIMPLLPTLLLLQLQLYLELLEVAPQLDVILHLSRSIIMLNHLLLMLFMIIMIKSFKLIKTLQYVEGLTLLDVTIDVMEFHVAISICFLIQ
jgi:hypothetical protein